MVIQKAGYMKYKFYIGIDTGTKTGFALWDAEHKNFSCIETKKIHETMEFIRLMGATVANTFFRIEDARKRKWFGNSGREQLQGAGSIKRDAVIWEDYLTDLGVDFEMVAPKNNKTKMPDMVFRNLTGWKLRTDQHSRDAAMLVFGM